jgi:hypothetical protein
VNIEVTENIKSLDHDIIFTLFEIEKNENFMLNIQTLHERIVDDEEVDKYFQKLLIDIFVFYDKVFIIQLKKRMKVVI